MIRSIQTWRGIVFLLAVIALFPVTCLADVDVDQLLTLDEPPTGVVFEIVDDDDDALSWALPKARQLSRQIHARFPDLPIAIVTHGSEQFALLASQASGPLAPIHVAARGLREDGIDLHVCGAHAGWYGHLPEDFPDYVDVSASGPAQINDYRNIGYEVIRLQSDDD